MMHRSCANIIRVHNRSWAPSGFPVHRGLNQPPWTPGAIKRQRKCSLWDACGKDSGYLQQRGKYYHKCHPSIKGRKKCITEGLRGCEPQNQHRINMRGMSLIPCANQIWTIVCSESFFWKGSRANIFIFAGHTDCGYYLAPPIVRFVALWQ
jgi:hypothetical protein